MHICKKNLFFLPSTLLFPTHLPLVSHLSLSEPHRNFIGTSSEPHRNFIGTSSEPHRNVTLSLPKDTPDFQHLSSPLLLQKNAPFQSAFLYSYHADTYNPFSSLSFSSSNSEISSAWRMYSSHSLGSQFLTIIF